MNQAYFDKMHDDHMDRLYGGQDTHHCDLCESEVDKIDQLTEATGKKGVELVCECCAERHDLCQRCDAVIVESEYCHDEYCDSCCDILADKSLED